MARIIGGGMTITLLGYACGLAAGDVGCADGPVKLYESDLISVLKKSGIDAQWMPLFFPVLQADKYSTITLICEQLARAAQNLAEQNKKIVTLAGDHSCAIGTWSGVAKALRQKGDVGLIWVDAHLDSHTPETTPSGNIHGMPLATLLGHGDYRLTHVGDKFQKLKPENVCIIGARSFESGELQLLEKLNVRIFYIEEIQKQGLDQTFAEAKKIVSQRTVGYGVSIDLDAIDPIDAPGVGTPEKDGLHNTDLIAALNKYIANDKNFLGVEVAEFNPHHDVKRRTERIIIELIKALFSA